MVRQIHILACALLITQAEYQKPFRVTSEELANQVINHVEFVGELSGWSEEERLAYLRQFDIRARAAELIPEGAVARSPEAAQAVLASASLAVRFDDTELTRLALDKGLMDQVLHLRQTTLLPRLSQHDRETLKRTVLQTVDRAESIVEKHLADIIPRPMIASMGQTLREDLVNRMNDPTTYWMKQQPDEGKLDEFLVGFEDRLAASRDRALRRLEHVEQLLAQDRPGSKDTGVDLKGREMREILEETLRPLRKALLIVTSPPELLELNKNPDRVLPGYSDAVRRWADRHRLIAKAWQKQRREQKKAARLAEELRSGVDFAAQIEMRNLDLELPVETAGSTESRLARESLPSSSTRSSPGLVEATPAEHQRNHEFFLMMGLGAMCVAIGLILVFRQSRVTSSKPNSSSPSA